MQLKILLTTIDSGALLRGGRDRGVPIFRSSRNVPVGPRGKTLRESEEAPLPSVAAKSLVQKDFACCVRVWPETCHGDRRTPSPEDSMRIRTHLPAMLALIPILGQGQAPAATPRLLGSMVTAGGVFDVAPTPDGRRLYYKLADSVFLYDLASRQSTRVTTGSRIWRLVVSRQQDQLAYSREGSTSGESHIWTLPLDPRTGLASGPARRASMSTGDYPAFSPDGKSIAFVANLTRLTVIPASGGRERVVAEGTTHPVSLAWSPDGKWLYYRNDPGEGYLERIAIAGGTPVRISEVDESRPGLSPDGSMLAFSTSARPWVVDVTDLSGKRLGEITGMSGDRRWSSPTSIVQWTSVQANALRSLSLDGGTIREVLPWTLHVREVAWAPDGRQFAAITEADAGASVVIASSDGSTRRSVALGVGQKARDLSWSPDGRRLVVAAGDSIRFLIIDVATRSVRSLPTSGLVDRPHWSADSKRVIYVSGTRRTSGGVRTVRNMTLDGRDVLVREIDRGIDNLQGVTDDWSWIYADDWSMWFASDTAVIVKRGDSTDVVSLKTGRSIRLLERRSATPSVSPRGDMVVLRPLGPRVGRFEFVTAGGRHVSTVETPNGRHGPYILRRALLTPGGESIIFSSGVLAEQDRCCQILISRLDGTSERRLVDLSGQDYNQAPYMALSPDGRTLLFTVGGPYVTTFQAFDVTRFKGQPGRP